MKITIDLPPDIADEAREIAARDGTTLEALVEIGLRAIVKRRHDPTEFRLRDASVPGRGLQASAASAGWDTIRDGLYDGRRR
jgi:hypothetical protein